MLSFALRRVRNTAHRFMSTSSPQTDRIIGPVETSIREKLTALLNPAVLSITNDSWQHRHHIAMRDQGGGNGETHFTIHIESDAFKGKNLMQQHRMIYQALSAELKAGLHALSLKTKTPDPTP
ncbi:bola-like protein [Rickenella mellea]|uniref:Bola-like protein n=1 Tax=Rickenella mellea TaxID=50990 RepID=A0A4Y7QEV8_9AGAM|nr:bola-like protein [Rickenella mellea]